jgi:hypothetical protein
MKTTKAVITEITKEYFSNIYSSVWKKHQIEIEIGIKENGFFMVKAGKVDFFKITNTLELNSNLNLKTL